MLADRLEVIAPKKALLNSQNLTTGTCQCNAHKQSSRPVNTRSGAYWTRVTDLAVQTPGPALAWSRSYVSQALTDTTGVLGIGWQHPFATHIITPTPEAGRVLIFSPEGNEWRYEQQDDRSYTASERSTIRATEGLVFLKGNADVKIISLLTLQYE